MNYPRTISAVTVIERYEILRSGFCAFSEDNWATKWGSLTVDFDDNRRYRYGSLDLENCVFLHANVAKAYVARAVRVFLMLESSIIDRSIIRPQQTRIGRRKSLIYTGNEMAADQSGSSYVSGFILQIEKNSKGIRCCWGHIMELSHQSDIVHVSCIGDSCMGKLLRSTVVETIENPFDLWIDKRNGKAVGPTMWRTYVRSEMWNATTVRNAIYNTIANCLQKENH